MSEGSQISTRGGQAVINSFWMQWVKEDEILKIEKHTDYWDFAILLLYFTLYKLTEIVKKINNTEDVFLDQFWTTFF